MRYSSVLATSLALASSAVAYDHYHSHDNDASVWKALEDQPAKRQAAEVAEEPASKSTLTFDPPASMAADLKAVWDHATSTYSNSGAFVFKNYGWDQLMATDGKINLCVRWDSKQTVSAATREKILATAQKSYESWFSWMYGFDNFPFSKVSVSIVGWAVNDASLIEGSTEGLDIYTNDKDADDIPQCAASCGRMFNQDGQYSACAGGAGSHYDQSLWLTDGFGGGAGGDWGSRMGTEYFLQGMETGNTHIYEHEIGHTFALDDFYDWKPAGQSKFIMLAGSSSVITEFDGWMLRNWWYELSRNRDWQSNNGGNRTTTPPSSSSSAAAAPPTVPTSSSSSPVGPTRSGTSPPAPTYDPTAPVEEPTVPTYGGEVPPVSTYEPTAPADEPAVPTYDPTAPVEEPTVPEYGGEVPPVSTYDPAAPTEQPAVPTYERETPAVTGFPPSEPSNPNVEEEAAPNTPAIPTTLATSTRRRKNKTKTSTAASEPTTDPNTSDENNTYSQESEAQNQGSLSRLDVCSGWGYTDGAVCGEGLTCTTVSNGFGICL
ncbi:hypothetical protein Cpir12675_000759 [Ceratocystis pirilliformis]|uniref:Uncharacterized protein n=1 Tax=Ceratocystis pirilliformis TaxID=259994 RepID=A0ABR3ZKZ6_9PEZI